MGGGMAAAYGRSRQQQEDAEIEAAFGTEEEGDEIRVSYAQWTELSEGAGYTASGKTVGKLPSGFYDLTVVNGTIIWLPVKARTDLLLEFPDSAVQDVVEEIETFWAKEEAFRSHELPYKRGILLWGPAGSGKSSTLQLLARDVVRRNGIVLLFGQTDTFVAAYRQLRDIQPDTPLVVLMEDLDAIIERQNESKILNVLDGVEDMHKVVFVATTNFPEKLGARIVNRPSRFDRRFKIPHPADASRKMYLETLMRKDDKIDVDRMIKDSRGMSLAHLKELFVATTILGSPYDQTVKILQGMREKASSAYDEEEFDFDKVGHGQYA